MNTQFTFTTENGGPLGALRFLQYLDEDVQGAGDDVFLSAGTAASGDLELFTFDNTDVYGLSHSGVLLPGTTDLQNASFTGWAADRFNNMKPLIEGVGQLVSPTGVITNLLSLQHPQLGASLGRLTSFPCWPGTWTRMRPVRSSPLLWAGSRYRRRPSRSVPSVTNSVVGAGTVRFRPRVSYRRPRERCAPIRST